MDLAISHSQFDAVRNAKHLPDVLKRVFETAKPADDGGQLLHLTYEEATALQELCEWNVHTNAAGEITPESRDYDDLVKAIITHPDF